MPPTAMQDERPRPALRDIFPAYYVIVAASLTWDWIRHETWTGGRISYPMYLWHLLAIGLARHLVQGLPAQLALGGLLTAAIASCSYSLVEKPALRLKARLDAAIRGPGVVQAAGS